MTKINAILSVTFHMSFLVYCLKAKISNLLYFQLYLSQYGYLGISPTKLVNSSNLIDGRVLSTAVADFQSFAGIDITGKAIISTSDLIPPLTHFILWTGELDDKTIQTMSLPRCGVKDKVGSGSDSRAKRYVLQGECRFSIIFCFLQFFVLNTENG